MYVVREVVTSPAGVSRGLFSCDECTCCHAETEAAEQPFYPAQSQYIDTGLTSLSVDPITPGGGQGMPPEYQLLTLHLPVSVVKILIFKIRSYNA